jgi:hypothetical protein
VLKNPWEAANIALKMPFAAAPGMKKGVCKQNARLAT